MSNNLCDKIGSNTNDIKCDARRGRPVVPLYGGKVFDSSEYNTPELFKAALKASMNLPTGDPDKLFALPENVGMDDKTTAPKEGTLGSYGPNVQLIGGRAAYEFDLAIGTTLEKKFLELNGEIAPFFIWDDKRNFWGADDGEGGFKGYDCMIAVISKPFEDGKDARVTKFKISIISQSEFEMDGVYVPAKNLRISDFKGLADISLRTIGVGPFQSTLRISTERGTSVMGKKLNIFPDYKGGALASPAAWYAKRLDTMAAITVQAVSINENVIGAVAAVAATGTVTITGLGQSGVAPTKTVTITAIGANGDTIDIPETLGGGSLTNGPVTKTSSETTASQLATKVAAAITTAGGGGTTAVAAGPVITITLTKNVGDNFNGMSADPIIVGTITATHTAYINGVDPDYFDIRANGTTIIWGPGYPQSAEATTAEYANNIAGSITANAGNNGGYTATAVGSVITIVSPARDGGSLTGTGVSVVPSGAQTFIQTPWAGGVYASDEVPAGEGFGISLNRIQVDAVPSSVKIEVGVRDVTTIQALGVKGIEVMNAVEYEVA